MDRRYRAGVIGRTGRGNYGHGLDTVYLEMDDVDIIAVADDDPDGLREAGRRLGVRNLYTDYREMLRNEWFDIVSICPRWLDQHAAMTLAVAEAGACIFLEKPMARTLSEADAMIEACEKAGVMMGIAHQGRMHTAAWHARQLIVDGAIGDILHVGMNGKEDHRGGGEDLMVLGTHLFDMLRFLLGRNPAWVQASVTMAGGRPRDPGRRRGGSGRTGSHRGRRHPRDVRFRSRRDGHFRNAPQPGPSPPEVRDVGVRFGGHHDRP